ncbi:MAG: hypothetical protein N2645_20965 [Clostridia bacterium]|nr:hypothetical protein [Clostridia bacterium]
MIRINRLKIIVKTEKQTFGFDQTFDKRINFISSYNNTRGKSSCILAIYYCLGLEELIGGKKEKALMPVFKKELNFNDKIIQVLETEFYLEIQNSTKEIVTIYRTANKENHDANLITLYYGTIDAALKGTIKAEDMYLHSAGAAINEKGFHKFLESFIGWELPEVPTFDGCDRKLYLQILFSAIFIEQKRGWSDLFATMPTYGIKDPERRTIEFLIGLDTLKIEKLRQDLKIRESRVKEGWERVFKEVYASLNRKNCYITGLPAKPEVIDDTYIDKIIFNKRINENNNLPLEEYIKTLNYELSILKEAKLKVKDNIDALQIGLVAKREEEAEIETLLLSERKKLLFEKSSLEALNNSYEIVNKDLINNKDALKIKKLGSAQAFIVNDDRCPTCNQSLHDSLLPQDIGYNIMSIDDNISHLEAQKSMIDFAINSHKQNINNINSNIQQLEAKLFTLRRTIRSLVNDIYAPDENSAESVIQRRVLLQNEIEDLNLLESEVINKCREFKNLSDDWKQYLVDKKKLPSERFTEHDKTCLEALTKNFKNNLRSYGYKSISDFNDIGISEDKFTPTSKRFDIKFDSSASDYIRAIWAYTIALMQTSIQCSGNHPNILIFDEPDQQSVIVSDLQALLQGIADLEEECQVIIGMTLKDEETKNLVSSIDKKVCKIILVEEKSITPIVGK